MGITRPLLRIGGEQAFHQRTQPVGQSCTIGKHSGQWGRRALQQRLRVQPLTTLKGMPAGKQAIEQTTQRKQVGAHIAGLAE